VTLHAHVVGDGPALVLLHGFTGSAAAWGTHLDAFAARHRVIAVDLPGHGGSPASPLGLWGVADAVVDTVTRLGVARADWLGYSLGGRVAMHVALRHPERVDRLVLESASPGLDDPAARATRAAADDALADTLERDGLAAFVDRWLAQPLFATQALLPAPVRAAERERRLAASPAGLAAALRAMSVGRQEPLLPRLAGFPRPTLLIAGADDPAYRAHAARLAATLPDAQVAVVAGAGHTTHLENPAAFRAAVDAFLASASRQVSGAA
jgi:2-succinyl-6-hydroxy-2,4-cyclohexadiene-1-carboxylate synthase